MNTQNKIALLWVVVILIVPPMSILVVEEKYVFALVCTGIIGLLIMATTRLGKTIEHAQALVTHEERPFLIALQALNKRLWRLGLPHYQTEKKRLDENGTEVTVTRVLVSVHGALQGLQLDDATIENLERIVNNTEAGALLLAQQQADDTEVA